MVKIELPKNLPKAINYKIWLLTLILILSISMQGQVKSGQSSGGKRRIDLKHADEDIIERDKLSGKDWHRLIGNVDLAHNEITMKCDSAHFFPEKNQVTAYSNIHIEQGDTLDIMGNYLFYDGTTEKATLKGNAELIDKETHLYTNSVTYDVRNKIARYTERGRITNGDNRLTSIIGIYYLSTNTFHFKDSVKIVNPDYIMNADTMDYNTKTETAFFTGPSEIKGDSLYLYCEKGWYDTKNIPIMYPFGHGLTYTSFEYSSIATDKEKYGRRDDISVSFVLKNTGQKPAEEVVQAYVHRINPSVDWPYKELKAFSRVLLQPGKSKTLEELICYYFYSCLRILDGG